MSDPLFEFAPAALLAVDAQHRVSAANRAALSLLGRSAAPPAPLDRVAGDEVGIMVHRLLAHGAGRGAITADVLDARGELRTMRIDATIAGARVILCITPLQSDEHGPQSGWWPTAMVAAAARELRTPLIASLGSLEQLAQGIAAESQLAEAHLAQDQVRAALDRLDALGDLARFEPGTVRIEQLPLNPVTLLEGAIGAVAARAHRRGLCATSVIDPAMPLNLLGDPAWFSRMTTLLLENALAHTRTGGFVLRARVEERQGARFRISVEVHDTGSGVPEALRPHLFEPLTMRPDLSWDRSKGLGVGLALCRRIARAMGGDTVFRAPEQGGSVFGFSCDLPLQGDVVNTLEPRIAIVRRRRVLLVDAHPLRSACFLEQRRRWGMDPRSVTDGRDIPSALRDGWKPDLVLINQTAPHPFECIDQLVAARVVGVVPIGLPPARELVPRNQWIEWISTPLHRDALLRCLGGEAIDDLDRPDDRRDLSGAVSGTRVLVVEDSESNRAVLLAQLQHLGTDADAVDNGADAIRIAQQRTYDLILLDLGLPDIDGTSVARRIRSGGGGGSGVPIVAVTATGETEDRQRALAAGINELLVKPLSLNALAIAIARWTGAGNTSDNSGPTVRPAPPPRASVEQAASVLSPQLLAELEADIGSKRFPDFLQRFAKELSARVERITQAIRESDLAVLERETHSLKSAARSYGAEMLSELSGSIESHLRESRVDAAMALAMRIAGAARQAQESITVLLSERKAATPHS